MLFKNDEAEDEDITTIAELSGVDERVVDILKSNGIEDIVQFIETYDNGSLEKIEGLKKEEIDAVYNLIKENVEFVDEDGKEVAPVAPEETEPEHHEEEKYYCPECGAEITLDMDHCPKCGIEFEFTEDEE